MPLLQEPEVWDLLKKLENAAKEHDTGYASACTLQGCWLAMSIATCVILLADHNLSCICAGAGWPWS